MSKELYFTDGNNEVKYLDTTASFNLAITQDCSAFDLTNATAIDVKVANDTGYVFTKSIDMATIKQPLAGLITMPVDAEVMNALVPDDYTIEVWVTLSSLVTPGSQEGLTDTGSTTNTTTSTTTYNAIFPSDDPQGFTITENVMSDSGDVIPVMSLDDFQQEFDQLKTDLTNKVSTLQGPKGDTGEGLDIKGKVGTTSQLPATASEGDGYLVGEELYVWTNNAWKDCGPLQGPQGIQGPKGDTGATGPQGSKGDTGATGAQGPKGDTGATGAQGPKGDKGDKGDTGATGQVGPQGPVGAGLVVKGTVNNASQLPKTGNQEGYCYFVGTDLYVWDAGAWKNCGSVSPDLSSYVTVTDLNNGLSTKADTSAVDQLKTNLTNQVSTLQAQVDNSAVGTNMLIGSGDLSSDWTLGQGVTVDTSQNPAILHYPINTLTNSLNLIAQQQLNDGLLQPSTTYTASFYAKGTGTFIFYCFPDVPNDGSSDTHTNITLTSDYKLYTRTFTTLPNISGNKNFLLRQDYSSSNTDQNTVEAYIYGIKLEKGSVATDWCPNQEDKQDKISYTPADDSKVVHSTVTELDSTDMNTVLTAGFYRLASGTNMMPNTDSWALYQVINLNDTNGVQLAYGTNNNISGMRSWHTVWTSGNPVITFNSWVQVADDSKVVHASDMRKPANDVAGIEEVNAKQDKIGYTPADDSKVSHLSGAEEISGQKTFDVAPIDKTTGNPYITKDGVPAVPSTLADTTKLSNFTAGLQSNGTAVATQTDVKTAISTATANMVDSTKATNFTAGLQSGGVDVATAADLKSVADKAWYQLDNKYITPASGYTLAPSTNILYRIDDSIHTLYLSGSIVLTSSGVYNVPVTVQLGSIIKSILTLSVPYFGYYGANNNWSFVHASQSSTNLTFLPVSGVAGITATSGTEGKLAFVTYDELV